MQRVLSILVVTLNESGQIPRLRSALDRLAKPAELLIETILLDGGSLDGTPDAARAAGFTKVIVIEGASIPVCRNRGLKEASGEWIAFLDGDCEPAADWLTRAQPFLETEPCAILGWPVEPPQPGTWVQRAWHAHWSHKNRRAEILRGQAVVLHEAFRLITTRNLIGHRAAFEQCDGFDERLVTGEDTDLALRAYARNIKIIGLPTLRVVHHGEPASLAEFFRQQLWHANRESYRRIREVTGGKVGGNAPRFTWLFLIALALLLAGPPTILAGLGAGAVLLLPLPGLIGALALRTALRARDPTLFFPLAVLYTAYGIARVMDLLGLHRAKRSWKRPDLDPIRNSQIANRKSE